MPPGWHIGTPPRPLHRRAQHAAGPRRQRLDQLDLAARAEHRVGPEPGGEVGLGVEPGDDAHLDVGVKGPQDGDGAGAEGAGRPTPAPGRRGAAGAG